MDLIIEDKRFENVHFTVKELPRARYENCTFVSCDFGGMDLSEYVFADCRFERSNFALSLIKNCGFRTVVFEHCKLIGLRFDLLNTFGLEFSFDHCILDLSSFSKLKIKGTHFTHCQLHDVDFGETDLSSALITNCDCQRTTFEFTNLEKADLRHTINLVIDPTKNRLKKAKLGLSALPGLVLEYGISIDYDC